MMADTETLHEMRPEILGATLAIEADGTFTETVAFTDEASARAGEKMEPPAEVQEVLELGDEQRVVLRPAPPVVRVRARQQPPSPPEPGRRGPATAAGSGRAARTTSPGTAPRPAPRPAGRAPAPARRTPGRSGSC